MKALISSMLATRSEITRTYKEELFERIDPDSRRLLALQIRALETDLHRFREWADLTDAD